MRDPIKHKAAIKKWRLENPEKYKEMQTKYRKKFRKEHKEKARERNRKSQKQFRESHLEENRAYQREYHKEYRKGPYGLGHLIRQKFVHIFRHQKTDPTPHQNAKCKEIWGVTREEILDFLNKNGYDPSVNSVSHIFPVKYLIDFGITSRAILIAFTNIKIVPIQKNLDDWCLVRNEEQVMAARRLEDLFPNECRGLTEFAKKLLIKEITNE
jgi:hypothetical protein